MPGIGDGANERAGDGELEIALDLHAAQHELPVIFVLAAGHVDDTQGVRHAHRAGQDLADVIEAHRLDDRLHRGGETFGEAARLSAAEFSSWISHSVSTWEALTREQAETSGTSSGSMR